MIVRKGTCWGKEKKKKERGKIIPSPNQQTPKLGELLRITASRTSTKMLSADQGVMKRLSVQFSSVAQLCSTLQPHGLHHARLPCPSTPTPGACSNSCLLSQWCHPTILSSVAPFSSCLQSSQHQVFSNESVLRIRWPEYWSFSLATVLPMNIQG